MLRLEEADAYLAGLQDASERLGWPAGPDSREPGDDVEDLISSPAPRAPSVREDDFADGHALARAEWGSPSAPPPAWDGEAPQWVRPSPLAEGTGRDPRSYRTPHAQALRDAAQERRARELEGQENVDPGATTGTRERTTLAVLEACTLRTEERLADLDAKAERLDRCIASAEALVAALGGRPGYGPPRQALSMRDREALDVLTTEEQEATQDIDFSGEVPVVMPPSSSTPANADRDVDDHAA